MTTETLRPNELADLYEAMFLVLENIPEESHPGWQFAVESVLFGGEGLTTDASSYGQQQSTRNDFKISEYRDEFGDGEHVTEFPAIQTAKPSQPDEKYLESGVELPVAPETKEVIPLFVDEDSYAEAISLLNEFPAEPEADERGSGVSQFLAPSKFPVLSGEKTDTKETLEVGEGQESEQPASDRIPPNELADVYDGLYSIYKHLPDHVNPVWEEAIETALFGGEYLTPSADHYGKQQADTNNFGMPEYRDVYGNGERVTDFPTTETGQLRPEDQHLTDTPLELPLTPISRAVLPLNPNNEDLGEALALLAEFPAVPGEDSSEYDGSSIIYLDGLLKKAGIEQEPEVGIDIVDTEQPAHSPGTESADSTDENILDKVLSEEGPGEESVSEQGADTDQSQQWKHEDPRAERAHRAAQKRDPSEVVELGEEIKLVVQEADYKYTEPTIMGTKNKLVVFVKDAPQGITEHDVIRAKVIDYGGNNNSAEAVFTGYA